MDADYAPKAEDRRSVPGGVVICAGACVSFCSRRQKNVWLYFRLWRRSTWTWPRYFAKRFLCDTSGVMFSRTAMLDVSEDEGGEREGDTSGEQRLLPTVQQRGRCCRAVWHLCEDGAIDLV